MLEPPNQIPLAKKILKNIQIRRHNSIRNSGYLKKKRFNLLVQVVSVSFKD